MNIAAEPFGQLPDGRQAMLYILENNAGMRVEITNFGGCIIRLLVPDRQGKQDDVVLGHPSFESYLQNPGYFGALVGRNCNRIAGATVNIGGGAYPLPPNDGVNNLHSGPGGLSFRLLSAEARLMGAQPVLILSHTIEDLGDGFPGNITITAAYALTDNNTLMIDYRAVSDKDTVINLTNHSYFNLGGHHSGPVDNHVVQMNAPFYNPNNDQCYPTGELLSVADTAFDFRQGKALGSGFRSSCEQIGMFGGYDHNLVLNGEGYRKTATVTEPASGRVMEMFTTLPAVQLYTDNGGAERPGKDGAVYGLHSALCLETQYVPNAVNMPWLRSPVFRAGEEYTATTGYRFSTI